jgi:uncharacterized glyoxalase superfamily protein PhnB
MIKQIKASEIILYVKNQDLSARFYQKLFRCEPDLNVPGMTEFNVFENLKIGLMPAEGIMRLLGNSIPNPDQADGIPRCELYFIVEDVHVEFDHAIGCGAIMISPVLLRDWGDYVCYVSDPDGHVIAFAHHDDGKR